MLKMPTFLNEKTRLKTKYKAKEFKEPHTREKHFAEGPSTAGPSEIVRESNSQAER